MGENVDVLHTYGSWVVGAIAWVSRGRWN